MNDRAKSLVGRLAQSLDTPYHGSSSMSTNAYDTAWVAMVAKEQETQDGEKQASWLFPECFQSILDSQSPDGGFGVGHAQVDGILTTMAALLALRKHHQNPQVRGSPACPDIADRIDRARTYLQEALRRWDVQSTVHVGFEILVPSLLRMLQQDGLEFGFPGHQALMAMNKRKTDKIKLAVLYSKQKTTLLHSLEAFVGSVDFSKTSHFLNNGSMMASPSSTAAYLINSSTWSDEAEKYLRFVVEAGKGHVPSAFPISVFEVSWVMSTLLGYGFTADELGTESISKLADFLDAHLQDHGGITGFSAGLLPDADDTAKSIHSLHLVDRLARCKPMIEAFEAPSHFKTYNFETSESFSANCNVLIALLGSDSPSRYVPQISKALTFLCRAWYEDKWSDKWNVEPQYPMMLLADALIRVIRLWNADALGSLPSSLITDRVPLITMQILVRTLTTQSEDGSWKASPEITAYAVMTLKTLAGLPWATTALGTKVDGSIELGTKFLQANESKWTVPEMIWVEKVTYGSSLLAETYCLAALKATTQADSWTEKVSVLCQIPGEKIDKFSHFFSRLPVLGKEPAWRLRASIVEGYMLAPLLHRTQVEHDVFPQKQDKTSKYLEYIPFTWTMCNNAADFGISTQVLIDMMVISMLNFQVDKWFEDATEDPRLQGDFDGLKGLIRRLLDERADEPNGQAARPEGRRKRHKPSNGVSHTLTNGDAESQREADHSAFLDEAESVLSGFCDYVLAKVSAASPADRRRVRHELSTFMQAHVTHGEDNARLSSPEQGQQPRSTYYDWVRSTSADHTSCPYSFELFRCLVASGQKGGPGAFASARSLYLAQDVCRHLATMCRQYNDYGSIARDRAEKNLNSVDFPEFHAEQGEAGDKDGDSGRSDDAVRRTLLEIAEYERECLDLAMSRLQPEITASVSKALNVFINVTDLYGQIYVVRDINA